MQRTTILVLGLLLSGGASNLGLTWDLAVSALLERVDGSSQSGANEGQGGTGETTEAGGHWDPWGSEADSEVNAGDSDLGHGVDPWG